jgi:hypothetical protein
MKNTAIWIAAIAVALTAAACGGSSGKTTTVTQGASSETTTATTSDASHALSAYLTQVNAARQTIQATVKDIHGVNLGNSPDQSWVSAGKRLEHDASDLTDEADKMASIQPPAGMAAAHRAYLNAMQLISTGISSLGDDLVRKDEGSVLGDINTLRSNVNQAYQDTGKWRTRVISLASKYGVKPPSWVHKVGRQQ